MLIFFFYDVLHSEILPMTRRVSMNLDKQSVSLLRFCLTEHKEYIFYTINLFQFHLLMY